MNDQQDKTPEAELVCYEAYQVVGSLLSDIGKFYTPEAQKVLDNLSQARLVHADVLPWPSYESATSAQEARIARLRGALQGVVKEFGATTFMQDVPAFNAARAALKETQPGEQG